MKRRDPPFDEFKPGTLPDHAYSIEHHLRNGATMDEAKAAVANAHAARVYVNALYQVSIQPAPAIDGWPAMLWLSIKRRDRRPIHDWRHLQRIKNALVGPECEAVELYPAESRLVDEANQFHLWALAEPGVRFPFGYTARLVGTPEEAAAVGAMQRPLDDD